MLANLLHENTIYSLKQVIKTIAFQGGEWGVSMSHVNYKKWSNLGKVPLTLSILRKAPVARLVEFKKSSCRVSLRPERGRVALSF